MKMNKKIITQKAWDKKFLLNWNDIGKKKKYECEVKEIRKRMKDNYVKFSKEIKFNVFGVCLK